MKLPRAIYGTERRVAAAARKAGRKIAKGASLADAFAAHDVLDTGTTSGLIMVVRDLPAPLSTQEHFHPALVFSELWMLTIEDIPLAQARRIALEALELRWGLLGMLGEQGWITRGLDVRVDWGLPAERYQPQLNEARGLDRAKACAFLARMVEEWPALVAEGMRYSDGDPRLFSTWLEEPGPESPGLTYTFLDPSGLLNKQLWEVRSSLKWALHQLGAPMPEGRPVDAEQLATLVEQCCGEPGKG